MRVTLDAVNDVVTRSPTDAETTVASVVVIDERPLVRAGIEALLESDPDLAMVGVASLLGAVEMATHLKPDVAVVGVPAEPSDALRFVATVKALCDVRVLLIVDLVTAAELREAVVAGADGMIRSTVNAAELRRSVAATARGERVVSPDVALHLVGRWRTQPRTEHTLTPRELEVLQHLAEGLTNVEVAAQLDVSPRTIKTHVQNLLAKLAVPDRAGAVARGFRLGLIR